MNENFLVSILVPVYGVEDYIERCSRSLFEQTYKNIEYIFVNDSTKDNSIDILCDIIKQYPQIKDKIKIINHERNIGLSGARITALKHSSGKYISWVDSDDYVEPDMIERMVKKVVETGADIVTCNTIVHYNGYEDKLITPQDIDSMEMVLLMLQKKIPVSVWARLIKKELYTKYNIAPLLGVNNGEDFQVMPRLVYYASISNIDGMLYHYNCCNGNAYTFKFSEKRADDVWTSHNVLKDFFSNKDNLYYKALLETEVKTLTKDLVNSCRQNMKDYYEVVRRRIQEVGKGYINSLPISSRIVYYLKYFTIVKIFVTIVDLFWDKNKRV